MSSREWQKIDADQRAVVERYLQEVPVRLGAMAKALGVDVKLSSLPANYSGVITHLDGRYQIKINRHESRERQRFTLAHELAHFLLHKDYIDQSAEGIKDNVLYRSGAPEQIEFEANRLAAHLVMPKFQINDWLQRYGAPLSEESIALLAQDFGVSKAAMEIQVAA